MAAGDPFVMMVAIAPNASADVKPSAPVLVTGIFVTDATYFRIDYTD
jgi:hypothetical protein